MGSYTFSWTKPADHVYVTGTFDNWGKSTQLEKKGDIFEKTVELPSGKILYKYVVDDQWIVDPSAKLEKDHEGNDNNVLETSDLTATPISAAISSVAPTATTAALAANVPLEKTVETPSGGPGGFPDTPALETQEKEFSVNPIPASDSTGNPITLKPGEPVPDPETITKNTLTSNVTTDEASMADAGDSNKEYSVKPIPATEGAGNPVHVAPGEKLPEQSTITPNTITSKVTTDEESYKNAGDAAAAGIDTGPGLYIPPVVKNMIPESSLPITIPGVGTIKSDVTAAKETGEVPEVVKESQEAAHVDPEASSSAEAVQHKAAVEEQLTQSVPVAAAAVTGTSTSATIQDLAAKQPIEATEPAKDVPEVVKESQHAAHVAPEASSSAAAVELKKEVEAELKSEVKPAEAAAATETSEGTGKNKNSAVTEAKDTVTGLVGKAKETAAKAKDDATPAKKTAATDATPSTASDKKKKRSSRFFDKLKTAFK